MVNMRYQLTFLVTDNEKQMIYFCFLFWNFPSVFFINYYNIIRQIQVE